MKGNEELTTELERIAAKGIQVDPKRLKQDMCSQFADPYEWLREYVVNAFDAKARRCWISAYQKDSMITISVEDDGHGMAREGVLHFATIYQSIKNNGPQQCIGRHGIGKLSVSAVPGQKRFFMVTSTGEESWSLQTGCLLSDSPVYIEEINPPQPRGTRFEIAFDASTSIQEVLQRYKDILYRYLRLLPMQIVLIELRGNDPNKPDSAKVIHSSLGSGGFETERFGRTFSFKLGRMTYRIAIGLGTPVHEVYQNYVMVSDKYNLLFFDREKIFSVPHLNIRVDSPDFDLPFGRHRLSNEEALYPLSRHLREVILPQYLQELFSIYEDGLLHEYELSPHVIQEVACVLMSADPDPKRPWCRVPVFAELNGPRVSLNELERIQRQKGVLYLEGENDTGTDYSFFDAPVLSLQQAAGGLKFLKERFEDTLINLDSEDIVLESPKEIVLNSSEERFASCLGFHPEVLKKNWGWFEDQDENGIPEHVRISISQASRFKGAIRDLKKAEKDLESIRWRANYLVNRDGKTPCRHRLFLYRNGVVVLNLYHPTIKSLVKISAFAPGLAGHWAMAMCLSKRLKILPHLTDEAREDLVMMDAIAKCGMTSLPQRGESLEKKGKDKRRWQDFLREIEG